jgi:predicted regulator of Ras-like GTPase activity (Roadblock/LC7/MglB family)
MNTLPQLLEEDVLELDDALSELLNQTEATTALVMDKGGFLIAHQGNDRKFDLTTIAALASGAYLANQTIAGLVQESNFNSVYQQGDKFSLFAVCIDEHCLLLVVFQSQVGIGAVKHFAMPVVQKIADRLKLARARNPADGFDLSVLNLADSAGFFRKPALRAQT